MFVALFSTQKLGSGHSLKIKEHNKEYKGCKIFCSLQVVTEINKKFFSSSLLFQLADDEFLVLIVKVRGS